MLQKENIIVGQEVTSTESKDNEITIHNVSIHTIDMSEEKPSTDPISNINEPDLSDFKLFVINLINDLFENSSGSLFKFEGPIHEHNVPGMIENCKNNINWIENTQNIADTLLKIQKKKQKEMLHLSKLLKGCLLQIHISKEESNYFILAKIDHDKFIGGKNLSLQFGLPVTNKKTQKTCLINISDNFTDSIITISDNNAKIVKYWTDFLEVLAVNNSKSNTKNAYVEINLILKKSFLTNSLEYYELKNDITDYFRLKSFMVYNDLKTMLNEHPLKDKGNSERFEKLKSLLKTLPESLPADKKFDSNFEITYTTLSTLSKQRIFLGTNLSLSISGHIEKFKEKITKGSDKDGSFIKIYTENIKEI